MGRESKDPSPDFQASCKLSGASRSPGSRPLPLYCSWTPEYTDGDLAALQFTKHFHTLILLHPGKKPVWKIISPIVMLWTQSLSELKCLAWGPCIPILHTFYYAIWLTVSTLFQLNLEIKHFQRGCIPMQKWNHWISGFVGDKSESSACLQLCCKNKNWKLCIRKETQPYCSKMIRTIGFRWDDGQSTSLLLF